METEKVEKEAILSKFKNNKKVMIWGVVILLAVGSLMFALFTSETNDDLKTATFTDEKTAFLLIYNTKDNLTAEEIYQLMIEDENLVDKIKGYELYTTKREDPNGILGDEGTYTSKCSFDDIATMVDSDKAKNITIEVFRNVEDAAYRIKEVDGIYKKINEVYPIEEYGNNVLTYFDITKQHMLQIDNAVLRISDMCSKEVIDLYMNVFKEVLKDKTYAQVDVPKEDQEERLAKKLKHSEINAKLYSEDITDLMEEKRTHMDTLEEELRGTFNQGTFDVFKANIETLNIGYFKDDIGRWRTAVDEIQAKVDEENRIAAREEALRAGRHQAGMYKVGVDIPAGEYIIVGDGYFEICSDSSGTLSSIIANDNFIGNSIVKVSDGQYLTVKNAVFYESSLNPSISTTGSGMFKVGVHIPAGEYKVIVTNMSGGGYVEICNTPLHTLDSIVMNDFFEGERYITLREGQYVQLTYAKLQQ